MSNNSVTVATGSTLGAVAKVKSAIRRVLLGTSNTTYSTSGDYKVKILYCSVSAYWFTVVAGIVHALYLLFIAAFTDIYLDFEIVAFIHQPCHIVLEFLVDVCVMVALLIGLYSKSPGLLLPYRIICGLARVVYLFALGFMVYEIGYIMISYCYTQISTGNIGMYWSRRYRGPTTTIECGVATMILFAVYSILGVVAEAATKCAAQMKAEKKKTVLPFSVCPSA